MKVYFKGKNGELFPKIFPMSAIEIQDIIDRIDKVTKDDVLTFHIGEFDNKGVPYQLCGKEFTADIYKLNVLAEKMKALDRNENAAFCALVKAYPPKKIDDALNMCYSAGSIPILPCSNACELGYWVIDNDMMTELNDIPDNVVELLDPQHIGEVYLERYGGVIENEYYCDVKEYESTNIEITVDKESGSSFRLLCSRDNDEKHAQWYELPTDRDTLKEMYDMRCHKIESVLPSIQEVYDMGVIYALNDIAKRLKNSDRGDIIKLKAIMEAENTQNILAADHYSKILDKYELDRSTATLNEFGHKYLERLLPKKINLKNIDLSSFGEKMLMRSRGNITSYGAISGKGMELYPNRNNAQEQEDDEDLDEDEGMTMGGLSQ